MFQYIRRGGVCLLLLLAVPAISFAQAEITGRIAGVVADPQRALDDDRAHEAGGALGAGQVDGAHAAGRQVADQAVAAEDDGADARVVVGGVGLAHGRLRT